MVNVLRIGAAVREPLEAFGTLERFLAAVQPAVLRQVVLVLESLVTLGTLVRTQI